MSLIEEYGNRREQKGRKIGIKKGIEKGKKEGMKKIIESLIKSGSSLNEISQNTGITLPELKKILKD